MDMVIITSVVIIVMYGNDYNDNDDAKCASENDDTFA